MTLSTKLFKFINLLISLYCYICILSLCLLSPSSHMLHISLTFSPTPLPHLLSRFHPSFPPSACHIVTVWPSFSDILPKLDDIPHLLPILLLYFVHSMERSWEFSRCTFTFLNLLLITKFQYNTFFSYFVQILVWEFGTKTSPWGLHRNFQLRAQSYVSFSESEVKRVTKSSHKLVRSLRHNGLFRF